MNLIMADLTKTTTLINGDVFDPQVVSDMINAKVEKAAAMTGYITVNNKLEGVAGSKITVPKWGYIGAAEDYAEGEPIDTTKMAYTTAEYGIKKIGKGVRLTDEAQLSGFGNPMGTATNQIALSISEKLDNDRVAVLYDSKNVFDGSASILKYSAIVDGVDMFNEERESRKVILIHSKQKTQLRKDAEFLAADKLGAELMTSGAIGKIAGCEVVVSNKVKCEDGIYYNPIIKLNNDAETEDDMPAVTYFLKRGNLVEHQREAGVADNIICTAYGMPALTNEAKVVILKTKEK
jgi:N4-gp56 family major capsid protein